LNQINCLKKAERNKAFLQNEIQLAKKYPDWISVVAFYSALHFVDAYLISKHGLHLIHHEERDQAVAIHMGEVYSEYHRLYDLGFRSRYLRIEDNPTVEEAMEAVTLELQRVEELVKSSINQ